MTRNREPRPRLGPEFTDRRTLLTYWQSVRATTTSTLVACVVVYNERNIKPLQEDHSAEEHATLLRWVIRKDIEWRFNGAVCSAAWQARMWLRQLARKRAVPNSEGHVRFDEAMDDVAGGFDGYHDETASDVATYAAQRWAEAALRAAIEEKGK